MQRITGCVELSLAPYKGNIRNQLAIECRAELIAEVNSLMARSIQRDSSSLMARAVTQHPSSSELGLCFSQSLRS